MSTTTVTQNFQQYPLGAAVPPFTAHAISVSLPTWKDTVGYEEGDKRVVDAMVSGYPRFFIHLSVQKLAKICEQKFGVQGERCLLCPTRRIAEQCRAFMLDRSTKAGSPVPVRLVQFTLFPEEEDASAPSVELHIVLFPGESFPLAKQFWQHTGLCVSSRLAERCLSMLHEETASPASPKAPVLPTNRPLVKPGNRHYSSAKGLGKSPPNSPPATHTRFGSNVADSSVDLLSKDHLNYLEERYGRNLPVEEAAEAKRAMRRRIAGVLVRDNPSDWSTAGGSDAKLGPSTRVEGVTEDDVFLYATGMSAIWSTHQLALAVRPPAKSICFGFPYADTLKILEKWGPGCYFLGRGLDEDFPELEAILEREAQENPGKPPALLVFTEFPSNPLLRTADLPRLRKLADKYDFLVVVDETVGNFVNVEVLPYADIVVSSLSKIFSGDANVMGGSVVLNPNGRHYAALKAHMAAHFEDSYYNEDAIYMERNSRDFRRRIAAIDANTLAVCEFLRSRSIHQSGAPAPGASSPVLPPVVKDVYYPKYITPHNYEKCRVRGPDGEHAGGYGGLFSVTFTSAEASRAFFDALPCAKGPSLGTNFTLSCPYTILAHYAELDWAAGWGVERDLVRVSVGMEDRQALLAGFEKALKAAEAVQKQTEGKERADADAIA